MNKQGRKPLRQEREDPLLHPNKQPEGDAEGGESHQTEPQIKIPRDCTWESGSVFKTTSRKLPLGQPCHLTRSPAQAGSAVGTWACAESSVTLGHWRQPEQGGDGGEIGGSSGSAV